MTQPVYLIDASIYIFRAYFSMPDRWFSPEGDSVNALYGYVQFLLRFMQKTQAGTLAAAFDESLGSCFRNEIYPEYKSSRALPDEALAFQLAACQGFTEIMGIETLASERYEADDIIATLASLCREHQRDICVVSRDKDLGQLLKCAGDSFWDFAADKIIKRNNFFEHFSVNPEQVVDYLALVGDRVDDIPGVPGIGAKTAAALLHKFSSVDQLYQHLDEVASSSIRGAKNLAVKLHDYRQQVEMARKLVRLHSQVPVGVSYQGLQWKIPDQLEVKYFLHEFGLGGQFERQLAQCSWWS